MMRTTDKAGSDESASESTGVEVMKAQRPRPRFGYRPSQFQPGDEVEHLGGWSFGVWFAGLPDMETTAEVERLWCGTGRVMDAPPQTSCELSEQARRSGCVWVKFIGVMALCREEDLRKV